MRVMAWLVCAIWDGLGDGDGSPPGGTDRVSDRKQRGGAKEQRICTRLAYSLRESSRR